jgi:hypothetical protein
LPEGDEIIEVGWFDPDDLPDPITNLLRYVLPDARAGRRGICRVVISD